MGSSYTIHGNSFGVPWSQHNNSWLYVTYSSLWAWNINSVLIHDHAFIKNNLHVTSVALYRTDCVIAIFFPCRFSNSRLFWAPVHNAYISAHSYVQLGSKLFISQNLYTLLCNLTTSYYTKSRNWICLCCQINILLMSHIHCFHHCLPSRY